MAPRETSRLKSRPRSSGRTRHITVVGPGPYGLATAAHLRARHMPLRIFGEPMAGWHSHMPKGMFLKSSPLSSSIAAPEPGYEFADFRIAQGAEPPCELEPIAVSEFVQYGLWFQRHWAAELERTAVQRIDAATHGDFRIKLESGEEFDSPAVIVAAGVVPYAHVPAVFTHLLADGLASHTADHTDFSRFAGQHVAVVGAGQSALESAALLYESGALPTVVTRAPSISFGPPPRTRTLAQRSLRKRVMYPNSLLGTGWPLAACSHGPMAYRHLPAWARDHFLHTVLGPSGAWWLRHRIDGHLPVLCGRRVRAASLDRALGARLELVSADGTSESVLTDHVLIGTGYRVDIGRLTMLSPQLRRIVRTVSGAPLLSADLESSVPGLFFTGLTAAPTFGPLLRFVVGTGFAARHVCAALERRNAAVLG